MGSIPLDNGESVYIHDGTGSADPVAISAAEGSSVADLMKNRERFDYTWADSTERTEQTGMVQGSRGYQEDTKSEYLYDNSAWRLALPYAEFNASKSLADTPGGANPVGVFSIDSTQSNDSTFAVPGGDGEITLTQPGIYAVSCLTNMGGTATSRSFMQVDLGGVALQRLSIVVGEDYGSVSVPNCRTVSTGVIMRILLFKQTGATATVITRLRIARMG